LIRSEKGFSIVEVLIAVAVIGIVAAGFLAAVSAGSRAIITAGERAAAEAIARSQMEDIKVQSYDSTGNPPQYSAMLDIAEGYRVTITAERLDPSGDGTSNDDGLQKITVTVTLRGKSITALEGYKRDGDV